LGIGAAVTETVSFLGSPTQRTAAALLSRSFAYDADVLPISYDGASVTVAVALESVELIDRIRQVTRKEVRTVLLPVREIREGLKALYPAAIVRDADSQAAVTLDEIFASAIGNYASDVHIEPLEDKPAACDSTSTGCFSPIEPLRPGCSNASFRSSKSVRT
jgi:hypothetical protein